MGLGGVEFGAKSCHDVIVNGIGLAVQLDTQFAVAQAGARFGEGQFAGFSALCGIGGFGVSSDLTWQAMASLGDQINDSAAAALGYRGIGTDCEDGSFGYDVISHGLLLGFECRF